MSDLMEFGKLGKYFVDKINEQYLRYNDPQKINDLYSKMFNETLENIINSVPDEKKLIFLATQLQYGKFKNLFEIIDDALDLLEDNANPKAVNDDWLLDFFDKAGNIQTEPFKILWSKILAEEINKPNSISKRLLHNLYLMSSKDAENFLHLSKFCFFDTYNDLVVPIIFIKDHPGDYKNTNVTTDMLKSLENFSLIDVDYNRGFTFKNRIYFLYTNNRIFVESPKIPAGNVKLTDDGQALFKIIDKINNDQILSYTLQCWEYYGCNVRVNDF